MPSNIQSADRSYFRVLGPSGQLAKRVGCFMAGKLEDRSCSVFLDTCWCLFSPRAVCCYLQIGSMALYSLFKALPWFSCCYNSIKHHGIDPVWCKHNYFAITPRWHCNVHEALKTWTDTMWASGSPAVDWQACRFKWGSVKSHTHPSDLDLEPFRKKLVPVLLLGFKVKTRLGVWAQGIKSQTLSRAENIPEQE